MVLSKRKPRRVRRKILKMRRSRSARRSKSARSSGRSYSNKIIKAMAPAVNKHDLKTRQTVILPVRINSRTLFSQALTDIPRYVIGTGAIPPNVRMGASVRLAGWRIKFTVENKLTVDSGVFNWAIIQPIGQKEVVIDGFFRTNNSSRDVNFTTAEESGVLQYNDISTDKHLILRHSRKFLAPFNANGYGNASCRYHHDEYIKFNGMLRFNDDVGEECENPVFFAWWFDYDASSPGQPAVADALEWEWKAIAYYDDTL